MNYKLFAILILSLVVTFASCDKDETNQDDIDRGLIEQYAIDNNLEGQFTSSGLYYQIVELGNSNHPTLNSEVVVSYVGMFLNNEIFDEGDYYSSYLSRLIVGWQEGLQLIGEEGEIILVIPSSLAYGSTGAGPIGPNQCLVFNITLHYINDK